MPAAVAAQGVRLGGLGDCGRAAASSRKGGARRVSAVDSRRCIGRNTGDAGNFDHLGEIAPWANFVGRLAGFARVIKFDRRGTGLSDRPLRPEAGGLESRIDDLKAVLDAVGSDRAAVMGIAAGSWAGALFAASHPERVSALILYWPRARNMWAADYPWGQSLDDLAEHVDLVRRYWGRREWARWDLGGTAPSLAGDPEMLDRWAAMARRS